MLGYQRLLLRISNGGLCVKHSRKITISKEFIIEDVYDHRNGHLTDSFELACSFLLT